MPGELTRAELRIWVTLMGGMRSLLAALDRELRTDYGISHDDYQILATLSRVPGRIMRMSDLARAVGHSPSRLSHAVTRMERAGWVERVPGVDDRRVVEARLTPEGARRARDVSSGHLALVGRILFDTLGPERARRLAALMHEVGEEAQRT